MHLLSPPPPPSCRRRQVRLALHPGTWGDAADAGGGPRPMCLFSKPVSTTHASRYTRQQLVGFTARVDSFDCVWMVVTPDPGMRAASEGVEVSGWADAGCVCVCGGG